MTAKEERRMSKGRTMMRRGLLAMAGSLLALGVALPVAADEGLGPDDQLDAASSFAQEQTVGEGTPTRHRVEDPDGIEWTAFVGALGPVAVTPDGEMVSLGVDWTRSVLGSDGSSSIDGVEWTLPR
ncbi:MAG: hypothetical protein H0V36_03350 [Chloroflexi bacterium]|nr:hypothetical protein [Chloroflexota bacterium]